MTHKDCKIIISVFLLNLFLGLGGVQPVYAAAIDNEQTSYGSACSGTQSAADWDTIAQCSSSVWQRGAYFLGTSSDSCDSNHAGMMIYNSGTNTITYCNGTSFVNFGGNGLRPTYTGVTNAATLAGLGDLGFSCYVDTSHNTYCVGSNANGYLGNGTTSTSYTTTPVKVTGGYSWSKVSTGDASSCGFTTSGAGYCWGANNNGNIGNGTTATNVSSPTAISGGYTWTDIVSFGTDMGSNATIYGLSSAWYLAACGIAGGTAYCWGDNTLGELGTGNNTSSTTPVAVTGGYTFTKLARGPGAYGLHMCGITSSGAGYCWGDNNHGQLGNNSTTNSNAPVAISGGYSWSMLAVGSFNTCGITTAGAAYCWGNGGNGEIGNNAYASVLVPTAVSGSYTWSTLAAGTYHACGITTGGTAYCWGDNFRAETGLGPGSWALSFSTPQAVFTPTGISSTGWTDITAGYYTSMGINNGSPYGWGYGLSGVFGDPYYGQIVPMQSQ